VSVGNTRPAGSSFTTKVLASVNYIVLVEEFCTVMSGMALVKSKIAVSDGANSALYFSDLSVDEVKKLIEEAQ
jgi:hypothetical protein